MTKNWHTPVVFESLKEKIKYSDRLLFTGSCFATVIGQKMKEMRFNSLTNPFGVMFNPVSVVNSIARIESNQPFTKDELVKTDDIYVSFMHGSEFCDTSAEIFIDSNNKILQAAHIHFTKCSWIVITLGTSWVFRDKVTGDVVANCHKLPASRFIREQLSVEETEQLLGKLINKYPSKNWILTVSPVRHLKDGAHANQISKARLLLAVDNLVNRFSNAFYFSAYEIFMDELRDYRFYAEDMVHPSQTSAGYIWDRFREYAIDPGCDKMFDMIAKLNAMKNHRPIFPESAANAKLLKKIKDLEDKIEKSRR